LAYLTADVIAALAAKTPVGDRISVDGGLSQSRYFCQMLANATGRSVAAAAFSELTGVGLSMLAAGAAIEISLDEPSLTFPVKGGPDFRPVFDRALSRSLRWR
jgi:glycerol kinase